MATWYEVRTYGSKVEAVDVVKETAKQLVIRCAVYRMRPTQTVDRTVAKSSEYSKYFPTFEEAKSHLIARTEKQLSYARGSVVDLEQKLQELMQVTE